MDWQPIRQVYCVIFCVTLLNAIWPNLQPFVALNEALELCNENCSSLLSFYSFFSLSLSTSSSFATAAVLIGIANGIRLALIDRNLLHIFVVQTEIVIKF